jgi:hypothetical protein
VEVLKKMALPDPTMCEFIKNLDDEELEFLLMSPSLVPELMGLTDHLPFCEVCAVRLTNLHLFDK